MIIDISSYNGKINFKEMAAKEDIERVILRGTTKNGKLDTRFMENLNGVCCELPSTTQLDVYKFSYARKYDDAIIEAFNLIKLLNLNGALSLINTIWLDLEPFDNREHTAAECAHIIGAYESVCAQFNKRFGIYCNYSYLKHLMPAWAQATPFWVARWGAYLGNVSPFNVELWQYTNKGKVAGITGDVDVSKVVNV